MAQEDKELLLKDLCSRLPYGVKIFYTATIPIAELKTINEEKGTCIAYDCSQWYRHSKWYIEDIKPYLRPMSSMTEEESEEYRNIDNGSYSCPIDYAHIPASDRIDWLNAHHFDYRGLIERGLATEAPKGMYKQKEEIAMTTNTEDYFAKLTKNWLMADSIQEMDRINNITRAILNAKNSI